MFNASRSRKAPRHKIVETPNSSTSSQHTSFNSVPSTPDSGGTHGTQESRAQTDPKVQEIDAATVRQKGKRAENFTDEKDEAFVHLCLSHSEDAITGIDQKKAHFWNKIYEAFKNLFPNSDRIHRSVTGCWQKLQRTINNFTTCYLQIKEQMASGRTEPNVIAVAQDDYMRNHGSGRRFPWEHMWRIVVRHPRWETSKESLRQKKLLSSQQNLDTINIQDDVKSSRTVRPIGRKSSERKTGRGTGINSSYRRLYQEYKRVLGRSSGRICRLPRKRESKGRLYVYVVHQF